MSIAENLTIIAENVPKVYAAGYEKGKSEGGDSYYDTFWDAFQQNGNRTSYRCAFGGDGWTAEVFKPKYKIKPKDANANTRSTFRMFSMFNIKGDEWLTIDNQLFDFTECLTLTETFGNGRFAKIDIDIPKVTNLNKTFANGDGTSGSSKITLRNGTNITSVTQPFYYSGALVDLELINTIIKCNGWAFTQSKNMSKQSITNIINALSDETEELTVTISKVAKEAVFTADEWATLEATKPKWTIALL